MKTPNMKTVEKYRKLLKGKVWQKQEIAGLLKLLRSRNYIDAIEMQKQIDLLIEEVREAFHKKSFSISAEHSDQGLEWLNTRVLLKHGGVAASSGFHDTHAQIIKDFKKFTWAGIHAIYSDNDGRLMDLKPIFEISSKRHGSVRYSPIHMGKYMAIVGEDALSDL